MQRKNTDRLIIRSAGILLLTLGSTDLLAKGGGKAPVTGEPTNWLEIMMVFVAVVLLFVIWGLGQTLLLFNRQLLEKRKGKTAAAVLLTGGLLGLAEGVFAQTGAETAANRAARFGGLSELEFYALACVIGLEVIVIFFLAFMARRTYRELMGLADKASAAPDWSLRLKAWWNSLDKKVFTRAVPVEKEADVLLDHDYDGIRELDNALPPWWKWGFYVSIAAGVAYMFYFHVLGIGMNPEQEYGAELAEGKRLEEQYKARTKNLVDEDNLSLADADGIAAGKALYTQSCVACHAADGGGGIGPNLTDNNWIHGGAMKDIYKTIKVGYPEKGMQSWNTVYSPVQMKNIASYIKSLEGSKPANPKEPQGEPYRDTPPSSAKTAADSSMLKP
jgi:cytochrome c oxidase cbb3-type subunit 3